MPKIPVSVVVFTKNESDNIAACIGSVGLFSEVVVVDSLSNDDTVEIAIRLGARVVDFAWNGAYPKKREWSLRNIEFQNDWILMLDADERMTSPLADEISRAVSGGSSDVAAGEIPLRYVFAGRTLRHGYQVRKRALLRVAACWYPALDDLDADGMGELEGHYQPQTSGRVLVLCSPIWHADVDPVWTWAARHVRYAQWEAYIATHEEVRIAALGLKGRAGQTFHKLPFKPLVIFVYSFVLRQGFRDGRAGFDYAFGLAWYYWLAGLIARETRERINDFA